jgi:hypothetical protein
MNKSENIISPNNLFQLSNVDADGEIVVSLLSSKSIIDGAPLVDLKVKHSAGL